MLNTQLFKREHLLSILFFGLGQLVFGLPELVLLLMALLGLSSGLQCIRETRNTDLHSTHFFWLPLAFASVFVIKLLSSLWSINPESSIDNAFNHLHFLLWPLVFYYLYQHRLDLKLVIQSLSFGLMVMLVWAIAAQLFFPKSEQAACFYAGVHNCGLLIQTLGISILILAWALLSIKMDRRTQFVLLTGIFSAFIVLWITERRTEWIALCLCLPLLPLLIHRKTPRLRTILVFMSLGILIVSAVAFFSPRFHQAYSEATAFFANPKTVKYDESSVGARLGQYQLGMKAFAEKPLLGWGAGIKAKHLNTYSEELRNPYPFSHFHNHYLQLLLEVGMIGFIFCTAIVFFIANTVIIRPLRGPQRSWAVLMLVFVLYHAIRGLANHSFGYSAPNAFFVLVTAWISAEIIRGVRTEPSKNEFKHPLA